MNITKRYSKKREAMLQLVRSTDTHPNADWVFRTLRETYPDISLGTIYRNLTLFQEEGALMRVGVVNGQERFDAITTPHPHFICQQCGTVRDLHDLPLDASLSQDVMNRYQFSVTHLELTFHGLCTQCLSASSPNASLVQ